VTAWTRQCTRHDSLDTAIFWLNYPFCMTVLKGSATFTVRCRWLKAGTGCCMTFLSERANITRRHLAEMVDKLYVTWRHTGSVSLSQNSFLLAIGRLSHGPVNGKWLPDFIEHLKASAWHQLYLPLLPFTHARSKSINADSLKLQLLTARKKEWWPATADNLPQAVTCQLWNTLP